KDRWENPACGQARESSPTAQYKTSMWQNTQLVGGIYRLASAIDVQLSIKSCGMGLGRGNRDVHYAGYSLYRVAACQQLQDLVLARCDAQQLGAMGARLAAVDRG